MSAPLYRERMGRRAPEADTIEQARLEARRHAGPTKPVAARIATRAEANDPTWKRAIT